MYYNHEMKKILYTVEDKDMKPKKGRLIERRYTINGDEFYCVKKKFGFKKNDVNFDYAKLGQFEWDGNEIYIHSNASVHQLAYKALGIVQQLKIQMLNDFKEVNFDIVVSIDLGDEDVTPSATVRFYAIRNNFHIISMEEVELYHHPLMICNSMDKGLKQLCKKNEIQG